MHNPFVAELDSLKLRARGKLSWSAPWFSANLTQCMKPQITRTVARGAAHLSVVVEAKSPDMGSPHSSKGTPAKMKMKTVEKTKKIRRWTVYFVITVRLLQSRRQGKHFRQICHQKSSEAHVTLKARSYLQEHSPAPRTECQTPSARPWPWWLWPA